MKPQSLETQLKKGTQLLEKSGIQEAGLDAWLLLEYTTKKNRAYYFAHSDEEMHPEEMRQYEELLRRRASHIPLQQLTHQAFFMGYEFYVNEHVLIPRQDTETLVEEALKILKEREKPRILDMCTGSGCILLSLLLEKEGSSGVGADISKDALKVAGRNAEALGVSDRAELVEGDLFDASFFQEKHQTSRQEFDILISNPPYIPTAEIEELMDEVRLHDPRGALDGLTDGLAFYRRISAEAGKYIKKDGWLLYEIGCTQGLDVAAMMSREGFTEIEIRQDLSGKDRVVLGKKQ